MNDECLTFRLLNVGSINLQVEAFVEVRSYRDLEVWRKAMELVAETSRIAGPLPPHEAYGLASQMRRAAVSVPANIAEGNRRIHRREYIHLVSIARGSLAELETHLEVAKISLYLTQSELDRACNLAQQIGRMLTAMIGKLQGGQHESIVRKRW